ncbi:MAG: tRNA lysidine(34) synthetase TilS [Fimbriimonadaceae bacterium]|nr:tRNA lysidine(34) synthetase TilS [Fimbriimonadaceae bacterium]QYK58378.1 MAG: tRNA lysidine(34) synthetase TilS [Fimbriimonadaceae bacterium]
MSGPIEERVDLSWWTEGTCALVGLSGGADSVCLTHLLVGRGVSIVAGHLHHGQRVEAQGELEACARFAEELGVPFVSGRAEVPRLAQDLKMGLEEAGRVARYQFFEQASRQTGCEFILTAHTLDDHVETVLLNLTRGCGLSGIAGIPARRGRIVRPLLDVRRSETRGYCRERGLWFHDDPANFDPTYSRVRIRQLVVPELERVNPQVHAAVARLAHLADQDDQLLNGISARMLEACERPLNGPLRFLTQDCEVAFDQQALAKEPPALVSRGLRLAVGALGGELDFSQTKTVLQSLDKGEPGSVTATGGGIETVWDGESVHVLKRLPEEFYRHPLTIPGETESLDFGWRIVAHEVPPEIPRPLPGRLEAVIDADVVAGGLVIGPSRPGDTIAPLGLGGTKKLSDVYREMGLTEGARRRLPVVWDDTGSVWVPGGPLSERFRVTENSTRALRIALVPPDGPNERPGA